MKKEAPLHKSLATYIKLKYPNVIFTSDSSGVKLTMGQAVALKALRSDDKIPDMLVFLPSYEYHSLFIEIKTMDDSPFLKDGSLSTKKHIQEQHKTLNKLRKIGYAACFGVGLDNCMKIIDNYIIHGIAPNQ